MVRTAGQADASHQLFPDLTREEVERLIADSGIPDETLRAAARLVYAWEDADEFDGRVLVIKIVETVDCRCRSKESAKDESGVSRNF